MRVLDLDLDFFLTGLCPFADEGRRPDDSCAQPLDEARVRSFLENNLRLSKARPLPGRVFETHDGALDFWQELLETGALTAPFSVTHVDAHTDLGICQKGYPFVKHSVLSKPPEKRASLMLYRELRQLNEANYLSFAIAFRWLDSLINVRHPFSQADLPPEMAKDDAKLQLVSAFPMLFEAKYGPEPEIAYREYKSGCGYAASDDFDVVSLAVSPRYAPRAADRLISTIEEYMIRV